MQVFCRRTSGNAECHCGICGQGFVIFWERQSRRERMESLHEIQSELRKHHRNSSCREVHPREGFMLSEWKGPVAFPFAAIPNTDGNGLA